MRGRKASPIVLVNGIENRECHRCNIIKPLDEFYNTKDNTYGKSPYCKKCISKWYKERNNPLKNKIAFLKTKYGITLEQYNEMYNSQKGCCAICMVLHKVLAIDHNHKNNKIRKLLCNQCNSGLGNFKEDIGLLNSAAIYLIENN